MDHALGGNSLIRTELTSLQQNGVVAFVAQTIEQPKTGYTAADNGDICVDVAGHICVLIIQYRQFLSGQELARFEVRVMLLRTASISAEFTCDSIWNVKNIRMYMRYLYSFVFYLLLPAVLLRLIWRGLKAPDYLSFWRQRFGYGPVLSGDADVIWIHAVSAGETIAAVPLIRRLQSRYSDKLFVVSNMTPTGAERTRTLLGDSVIQCYAPYDLPGMVKRFLSRVKPSLLLIIDTELWPNMIHYCNTLGVKTMLVNGRLSADSARGYGRIARLTDSMLNEMTLVATQTQQQGDRFINLGLPEEKLGVTGSIKFDLSIPPNLPERREFLRMKLGRDRLIFIAASTHQGEDETILEAFQQLRKKYQQLLLVIVPRHPERFDIVARQAATCGLKTVCHTQEVNCDVETDVLVVDAMGELMYFYAVADFAFVGGSLVPVGGHNMMEAAAFELPILMGPHVQNVDDIAGLFVSADAMKIVNDTDSLIQVVERLCADEEYRSNMGRAAGVVMQENRGSLDRVMKLIEDNYSQQAAVQSIQRIP